ncbi:MAG: hypothetical protein F9K24_00800 [Leptonema illini]|uniref:Uncharacterized protein n=1 Tax=Leptonema illini TaxID=183 RepID=A0A833LYW5_9LEPT|nr:MAG: hypothetical protein F9K24_00800 [Leptonema illini]PKL33222.1 MAG: hypothetical protein CVV45_08690 [Spirochaetae bacterium HGW-Spirochaetae-10]
MNEGENMSDVAKNYYYRIQTASDHRCHITPEGLSIEFRDGRSFQAAMAPARIFPDLDELDDDKQKFLVWYAKTKAKGRWFSAEEMQQLRLRHRDELAVADDDFEGLTSRAFDSMYCI